MISKPIQHYYSDDMSHCYGCGRLNNQGYQIKTYWDGKQSTTRFTPKEYHTAIPGYVYGGLIASLIDCHGTGTAAIAMAERRGVNLNETTVPRFVTASIQVSYRKPTPIGTDLLLRGTVHEITERKVVVHVSLTAADVLCAEGIVTAVEFRAGS